MASSLLKVLGGGRRASGVLLEQAQRTAAVQAHNEVHPHPEITSFQMEYCAALCTYPQGEIVKSQIFPCDWPYSNTKVHV